MSASLPRVALPLLLAAGWALAALPAAAHNGVVHHSAADAAAHRAQDPEAPAQEPAREPGEAPPTTPDALFPTGIGGPYALVDQHGAARDQRDPDGRPQLLFFGYASCEAICTVAMPSVAEAVRLLEAEGMLVTPVLITVDPENDTPAAMRTALARLHPRYVGLTGAPEALAAAERAFQVESSRVSETREGAPIYAHGSFVYLMDGEGGFLTLMPPILAPERMAAIVRGYWEKATRS